MSSQAANSISTLVPCPTLSPTVTVTHFIPDPTVTVNLCPSAAIIINYDLGLYFTTALGDFCGELAELWLFVLFFIFLCIINDK